jgi:hypothetical protein
MTGRMVTLLAGLLLMVQAQAAPFADEFEEKTWQENEIRLPPYPQDAQLYSFYVSPTTINRFFVDIQTLSVGSDGVVRYALVVISPSNARNVSYEGMRCQTREWRIYATGRPDGSWSKTRSDRWMPVREAVANRHHAALFQEFFCPGGTMNYRVEDIQKALKKEGRPLSGDASSFRLLPSPVGLTRALASLSGKTAPPLDETRISITRQSPC